MARRASSGVNSQAPLAGGAALALVLGGGYWFLNRTPSGFDAPEFDIVRDVDHQKSQAGNTNSVTGLLIDRQITPEGQLATLKIGKDHFLSIIIPSDLKGGNLNLQSEYIFKIEFNTDGVAVAKDVKPL